MKLFHSIVFLLAFASALGAVHGLDRVPYWSWVRGKFALLANNRGSFDTLFFGSSRVNYGLIPKIFDERAAELGVATRSFNCGVAGCNSHDFMVDVRWALAQRDPALKTIFVELHRWDMPDNLANWGSDQTTEHHPIGGLPERFHSLRATRDGWWPALQSLAPHATESAIHLFHIGQGPRLLDDLVSLARLGVLPKAYAKEQGFFAAEENATDATRKRHEHWLAEPKGYQDTLARKAENPCPDWLQGGFDLDCWRALHREILAAGIEPVYVVMPSHSIDFRGRDALPTLQAEATVLVLDDPKDLPDIFDRSLWWEDTHMLRPGAERLTRILAERWIARRPGAAGRSDAR